MDARLFFTLAGTLARASGPSELRTSISRCYYPVYNVAVLFLRQLGIEPLGGPQGHSAVRNGLLASQDAGLVKIGSDLDTLHGERRRADYDMADIRVESSKTALAVLNQAGNMLAALDACRLAPARCAQAEAAVKRWATSTPGSGLRVI
jgi:hypothetical protein